MKMLIQTTLRKFFGYELHQISKNPKEAPIPLINKHALRLIHFYDLMRQVKQIPGHIVECGVGWGRSLYAFCLIESIQTHTDRQIYGFDSFEGFPEPDQNDGPQEFGIKKGHYRTNAESVIQFLRNSGIAEDFIQTHIHLIKGFFPDSFLHYSERPIALLHLDVDLFQSYKHCLEYFYPRVAQGGIIAFDEYQDLKYSGCRKAVDTFFKDKESLHHSHILDRYYVIKGQ